jgi:hypothetical protein
MSVSSNLQTQPSWLDTFPDEDVAFGFDADGMWFSGNAANAPYPIRTNYDIDGDTTVVVVYTFVHDEVDTSEGQACPDHGICFFKADVEPYWSWGNNTSRIAIQYNCGDPEIEGQNENNVSTEYVLTVGDTYTARVTYNPVAETITHELFEGSSASGSPVDTITLAEEVLPAGAYRIGFHADLDTDTNEKSYFTYLEISEGPVEAVTRVFRALYFPHRRREVVSEVDPTPINVQPGEMLYDEDANKLYAGLADTTVVEVSSGGGGNPFDQNLNTTNSVTFANTLVDGQLQFKNPLDNTDQFYITKDSTVENCSILQIVIGDDPAGTPLTYPANRDYVAIMTTGGQTHHLFGSDGKYHNAGGITFGDDTTQTSAGVTSATTGITGAASIANIVSMTQAAYDALASKDESTLYIING